MNELIKLAEEQNMEVEINKESVKATEIIFLNGDEKSFQINNNTTYTIKALKNKKCVRFITETLDNPPLIIEHLENLLLVQENDNENRLSEGKIINELQNREKIDYQKIKKDLKSLNELKKEYPYLETIELYYGHYNVTNEIINSNATLKNESAYHEWAICLTMKKNDIAKIDYTNFLSKNYDFEEFKNYFKSLLETLNIKLLKSKSCKTNKYKIILKNNVVESILNTFASMFSAKSCFLNESVLSDKYNQKIFNELITIIEDPRDKNAVVQTFFDEEGTPTNYQELVSKGVFCKKVNTLEYALKLKEAPTGNAGGVKNLYIQPGETSYEELMEKLDNGIIIDRVEGLHSGINVKSGDISVQAEGLIIENGKIVGALQKTVLSTNIFELLGNVLFIGNDMTKKSLEVSSPSLLLENITIAGEE